MGIDRLQYGILQSVAALADCPPQLRSKREVEELDVAAARTSKAPAQEIAPTLPTFSGPIMIADK
jgi:hypothetical protein